MLNVSRSISDAQSRFLLDLDVQCLRIVRRIPTCKLRLCKMLRFRTSLGSRIESQINEAPRWRSKIAQTGGQEPAIIGC